jgi:hypothetical protein
MLRLPAALEAAFRHDLYAFEESRKMPYVTTVERAGIEKGLQQGKQIGYRKGEADLLLWLIEKKLGADAIGSVRRRIEAADNDTPEIAPGREILRGCAGVSRRPTTTRCAFGPSASSPPIPWMRSFTERCGVGENRDRIRGHTAALRPTDFSMQWETLYPTPVPLAIPMPKLPARGSRQVAEPLSRSARRAGPWGCPSGF